MLLKSNFGLIFKLFIMIYNSQTTNIQTIVMNYEISVSVN